MPYIKAKQRDEIIWDDKAPENAGELNYAITLLLIEYWAEHSNYQGINDIVGALECSKQEFYKRVATPYEKEKRNLNGDVYA